jgi:predicted nucleic acid-binding protein
VVDASFVVVLDANVLFPQYVRHLLLYLPRTGLVQLKWTDEILDETMRALARERPDIPAERIEGLRALIATSTTDPLVTGYEGLVDALELPDLDDRHVLAAAITCGAQVIVTNNITDFPDGSLSPYAIEAQSPDDFLLHLVDLQPDAVWWCLERMAADTKRPPLSAWELLDVIRDNGMTAASEALRAWAEKVVPPDAASSS